MEKHLLANKNSVWLCIFLIWITIVNSCSNIDKPDKKKFEIPLTEYKIPVVDSLKLSGYNIRGTNFEANYRHWQVLTIDSYLKIRHYFSADSIAFTNCDQVICYPTISYLMQEHHNINEKLESLLEFKVQNLIAIKEEDSASFNKAFYISWLNEPQLIPSGKQGHHSWFTTIYSDEIDSTTFAVFTTLDSLILRRIYPKYKGLITQIHIDTIFLPFVQRNSIDYYPEIKIDSFYYSNCVLPHEYSSKLNWFSKEARDSLKLELDSMMKIKSIHF